MTVPLGKLITGPAGRDAVHIAILPMVATRVMFPGERLANGIVDPFILEPVQPGQQFYLCLYPDTVTTLRHVWIAPGIPDEPRTPATEGC